MKVSAFMPFMMEAWSILLARSGIYFLIGILGPIGASPNEPLT